VRISKFKSIEFAFLLINKTAFSGSEMGFAGVKFHCIAVFIGNLLLLACINVSLFIFICVMVMLCGRVPCGRPHYF